MTKPLADRIALITGASSGMGRAHAEVLAERGAHVIVQDIFEERAATVADAIKAAGGSAEAMGGDASDVPDMRARVQAVEKRLGRIDILVNNAGISGMQASFEEVDEAAYDRMLAVHTKSAFFISQTVVPGMKERRFGRIVNVSSMFAMIGSANMPHYTTAKGGLLGLTKALALELGPWNITVNAIAPGLVQTEMTSISLGSDEEFRRREAFVPMRKLATARDLALAVAWIVSPDADLLTGQTISPNGGNAIVGI